MPEPVTFREEFLRQFLAVARGMAECGQEMKALKTITIAFAAMNWPRTMLSASAACRPPLLKSSPSVEGRLRKGGEGNHGDRCQSVDLR